MNWSFLAPYRLWFLLGVGVLAAAYIAMQFRRKANTVRFSNLSLLDKVAPSNPGWKRHTVAVMYLLALATMVVAMAQPQGTIRVPKERATIILAIDTSLSMQATDVDPTRIDSAKVAAKAFVNSIPEKLQVGLVSFNGSTTMEVRPTTDRTDVDAAIEALKLGEGTAIGDAVKVSLDAISAVPADDDGERPPAVVVLLSDGKTTMGSPTESAIDPAVSADVAVYTIAYGTEFGFIEIDTGNGYTQRYDVPVDEPALDNLAAQTGGTFFTAASTKDLTAVYDELGSSIGYEDEVQDVTWKVVTGALALLGLTSLASLWWFQRLP